MTPLFVVMYYQLAKKRTAKGLRSLAKVYFETKYSFLKGLLDSDLVLRNHYILI